MSVQPVTNSVQAHRKKAGFTQSDAAKAVGVSRQTMISLEKGNYVPSVALALALAKLFSVPVEQLFTLETSA